MSTDRGEDVTSPSTHVGMAPVTSKAKKKFWCPAEERALLEATHELILKGFKSDNGFRPGFWNAAAEQIREKVRGSDVTGVPHVKSKLHVWKKEYYSLFDFLRNSGVSIDPDSNMIIVDSDETWKSMLKATPHYRHLRGKPWPYYNDWCEIFGKDRATGEGAKDHYSAKEDVASSKDRELDAVDAYASAEDEELEEFTIPKASPAVVRKRKAIGSLSQKQKAESSSFLSEARTVLGDMQRRMKAKEEREQASVYGDTNRSSAKLLPELDSFEDLSFRDKIRVTKQLLVSPEDLNIWNALDRAGKEQFVSLMLDDNLPKV